MNVPFPRSWPAILGAQLTTFSVRWPALIVFATLAVVGGLLLRFGIIEPEVGFASYFGPRDPYVERLNAHMREFGSGFRILAAFGCDQTPRCEGTNDEWVLEFLSRFQASVEELPNVRATWSVLNIPIVVGPLETRRIAETAGTDGWRLADDWRALLDEARRQSFLADTVYPESGRAVGIVVELGSLDSELTREAVHGLLRLKQSFEAELGAPVYLAGAPIWTVISADNLDRDSLVLTVGMFAVMLLILWLLFRDPWLTALPVVAIAVLFGAVQGIGAVLSIPRTIVLNALPPILLAIALTGTIHFLSRFLARLDDRTVEQALGVASREIGAGCFWAAATTAAGLGSFGASDLTSFRHFGLLGSIGMVLSFLLTFTFLPALLALRGTLGRWSPRLRQHHKGVHAILEATLATVRSRPVAVVVIVLASFALLASGVTQVFYAGDYGFGEQSFVLRSVRYIEANLRRTENAEILISIPEGKRIYDDEPLQLLSEVEGALRSDSTGRVWSFLDVLQQAYRVDRGHAASSFEELVASARRLMPIVSSFEQASSFWSEALTEVPGQPPHFTDRTLVSADLSFLDYDNLTAYSDGVEAKVEDLRGRYGDRGYALEYLGTAAITSRFLDSLKDTQIESFAIAFGVVSLTLVILFFRGGWLVPWAIVANVVPVLAVLGLWGWARVGIEPASAMVGAVLLVVAVDDTIHFSIWYQAARRAGRSKSEAVAEAFRGVGEAIVISSLCLALGFSVMLLSEWSGFVSFGLLASAGVLLILVGDIFLLPAALLLGTRSRSG